MNPHNLTWEIHTHKRLQCEAHCLMKDGRAIAEILWIDGSWKWRQCTYGGQLTFDLGTVAQWIADRCTILNENHTPTPRQ